VWTRRAVAALVALLAALAAAPGARADDDSATHYYLALGDSLAASAQPNGDFTHGYAEQVHAGLSADDSKLVLEKLGCSGESTSSFRFGSQPPTSVLSCGTPRFYKTVLYPKGTQLAEAVAFLEAHKGKVSLITIDLGANDLSRFDEQFNVVSCLSEPQGCAAQSATMTANLAAILAALHAAAPTVPIVGMTYYNAYAPALAAEVAELNAGLAATYAAAGVPVADVAGAFHNDDPLLSAHLVCSWTWMCSLGDVHPNTAGYAAIANAFLEVIHP
jgi:lysophospholipase L1-like esterase